MKFSPAIILILRKFFQIVYRLILLGYFSHNLYCRIIGRYHLPCYAFTIFFISSIIYFAIFLILRYFHQKYCICQRCGTQFKMSDFRNGAVFPCPHCGQSNQTKQ